jgi:hypothetical protein
MLGSESGRKMKLKFFDYLSMGIALVAVGGFSLYAYSGRNQAGEVVIEASGTQWIYPLNVDRRELIKGPLGDTIVVIDGGKARVEDSPCPDKLCVHMPAISKPGQWIACLPNKVFVRVRGNSGETVDDLSY